MAQIVTSARLWPVRPEEAVRRLAGASDGQSFTRAFYLGVSFIFAVLTYLAVQVIQLVGAMLNATATATDPLAGSVFVHATSGRVGWRLYTCRAGSSPLSGAARDLAPRRAPAR